PPLSNSSRASSLSGNCSPLVAPAVNPNSRRRQIFPHEGSKTYADVRWRLYWRVEAVGKLDERPTGCEPSERGLHELAALIGAMIQQWDAGYDGGKQRGSF